MRYPASEKVERLRLSAEFEGTFYDAKSAWILKCTSIATARRMEL